MNVMGVAELLEQESKRYLLSVRSRLTSPICQGTKVDQHCGGNQTWGVERGGGCYWVEYYLRGK